jgi:hypothetical protein
LTSLLGQLFCSVKDALQSADLASGKINSLSANLEGQLRLSLGLWKRY